MGKYETERRKCWLEPSSRVLARRCLPSTREAQRLDWIEALLTCFSEARWLIGALLTCFSEARWLIGALLTCFSEARWLEIGLKTLPLLLRTGCESSEGGWW